MSSGSASGLSAPPPRPDRPPGYRRICRGPSKAHAMWVCDCGGRAMFLSSVISRHSGARTPDVPDHRAAARTGLYRVQSGRIIVVLVAGRTWNVRWTARTARRARAAPGVDIAHRSSVRRSQLSSRPAHPVAESRSYVFLWETPRLPRSGARVPAPRRHAPHPAHEATSATSDAPTSLLGRTLTCNERSPMPEAT